MLDLNCRAHDLDNLYVVDGSFFPSCGAVNPSLTIIANAIRVADHLIERMKKNRRPLTERSLLNILCSRRACSPPYPRTWEMFPLHDAATVYP